MRVFRANGILFLLALPTLSMAQVKPQTGVSVPSLTASTVLSAGDIAALPGTSVNSATSFLGTSCGSAACIIARALPGAKAAVKLKVPAGKQRAAEFRTGIMISHDVAHSLNFSLNGADVFGLLCNGHGALEAAPSYGALGASSKGFGWQLYEGAKLVKSGHSSGEAVSFAAASHSTKMAPMELAISDQAVIEIVHGAQRIVFTPDDKATIVAKSKGYVAFEDLGLHVVGPSEFAIVRPAIKSATQPGS